MRNATSMTQLAGRVDLPMRTRDARVAPATLNAGARTVEVVWTKGARVPMFDWSHGRQVEEELSLAAGDVDLTRLNDGAPVLNHHAHYDVLGVIGVVERAWVAGGEGRAILRFSDREDVEPIWSDIKARIIQKVSVGYWVRKYEITERAGEPPLYLATDWEPFEISMVALAADRDTGTRAAPAAPTSPCEFINRAGPPTTREATMEPKTTAAPPAPTINPGALPAADPTTAERNRATDILARVRAVDLPVDFAIGLIERGVSSQQHIADAIIDEIAARSAARPARPRIEGGADYTDPVVRRGWMAEALAARALPHLVKPSEAARQFMGMQYSDMIRECLAMRGERGVAPLSPVALIERIGGPHTTSDFPLLLGDAANRVLLPALAAAPSGVLPICRTTTAPNFRAKKPLRLGEAPLPERLNEGGEIKSGTIKESGESYAIAEYAKRFALSRQAIVNDDLGVFANLIPQFAQAAREVQAQTVVDLLTAAGGVGPTMADTVALFDAAHGNLAGAAGAADVATIGAARAAMRLQKGLSGRPVNIVPKFLLVNAAKETAGEQALSTIYAAKVSDVNPFSERLTLVVDPRLDAQSATAWYLAGDVGQAAIEIANLEGEPGPRIDSREGWTTTGMEFRLYMTFGAGVVDYRGIYRNNGA